MNKAYKLKLDELLLGAAHGNDPEHVEADGLRKRTTLTNGDDITITDTESRRNVGSNVLVALLVTVVLRNVVEILAADDDRAVHLGGNNGSG